MRISTIALTAVTVLSSAGFCSSTTTCSSTYVYNPNGETVGAETLPGPGHWPGACNNSTKTEQSPIAVSTDGHPTAGFTPGDYTFHGGDCTFKDLDYGILDNGVKVYYDATKCTPPSITIPDDPSPVEVTAGTGGVGITMGEEVFGPEAGKKYIAAQFHIHSSSEHTINNVTYEAEMHIVHLQEGLTGVSEVEDVIAGSGVDGSRAAAVLGFMLARSNSTTNNTLFAPFLEGWKAAGCGVKKATVDCSIVGKSPINPYHFLPQDTCIFNYDGSLTTPGCNEVVEWNLASLPVLISSAQMDELLSLINDCPQSISFNGSTSRPVQPLHGREVNMICPTSGGHHRRAAARYLRAEPN